MSGKLTKIFTFTIIGVVSVLIYLGYREPKVTVSAKSFNVQCLWSITVPIKEIVKADTISWKEMPLISSRTNGISLFGVHRGWFYTKERNTVWLSVKSGIAPVILIVGENGKTYYMNRTNTKETMDIFDELSNFIECKE